MSEEWQTSCKCGEEKEEVYNSKYDSYYCAKCNEWLEKQCFCGGDDCEWFPGRPEKKPV